MSRRRGNPQIARGQEHGADVKAALKMFKDAHWGIEADKVLVVHDKDLPSPLSMMGRLSEIEVESPRRSWWSSKGDPFVLQFDTEGEIPPAALCFDKPGAVKASWAPSGRKQAERLYVVMTPAVEEEMRRSLWSKGRGVAPVALSKLAQFDAHGEPTLRNPRQVVRGGFANVAVKPVGILTRVVYVTPKLDDAEPKKRGARTAADFHWDEYEHHMGEESGIQPWLGVDDRGRLWVAGGNYFVPVAGVTD